MGQNRGIPFAPISAMGFQRFQDMHTRRKEIVRFFVLRDSCKLQQAAGGHVSRAGIFELILPGLTEIAPGNPIVLNLADKIPYCFLCRFPIFLLFRVLIAQREAVKRLGLPEARLGLGGNAHSNNIGIAMLRSQAPGRKPLEQIQAVQRNGSHSYAHGHFDRASLLSAMRYGYSFFNPECTWWGYPHFMYKFYVQDSMIKTWWRWMKSTRT